MIASGNRRERVQALVLPTAYGRFAFYGVEAVYEAGKYRVTSTTEQIFTTHAQALSVAIEWAGPSHRTIIWDTVVSKASEFCVKEIA